MITQRVEALRKFKEEVSVFSLKYGKFESEQQPKLGLPVFEKGLNFYTDHNVQIIQELDNEIKRTEKEIDGVKAFREKQLKVMMMVLHATPLTMPSTTLNKKLEDAIDTLRDLPLFGLNNIHTDYRWPRERDLLRMPTDKPIQASKLRWKRNSSN